MAIVRPLSPLLRVLTTENIMQANQLWRPKANLRIDFLNIYFFFTDCLLDSVFDSSAGNCAVLYSKGDYAPVGLRIQRTVL